MTSGEQDYEKAGLDIMMAQVIGTDWQSTPVERVFALVPSIGARSDPRVLSQLSHLEVLMFQQLVDLRELDLRYAELEGATSMEALQDIRGLQEDLSNAAVALSDDETRGTSLNEGGDFDLATSWYHQSFHGGGEQPWTDASTLLPGALVSLGDDASVDYLESSVEPTFFIRGETLDHPQYGCVTFIAEHAEMAWVETKDGMKTIAVVGLRRKKDVPFEEKIVSLADHRGKSS